MSEDEETNEGYSSPAEEILMLRHVIGVHGQVLDQIATEARKMKLSGNPGVSSAGTKILDLIPS